MKGREQSTFQSLRRVRHHLDDNAELLGYLNQTPARITLDDVVVRLEDHTVEQSTMRLQVLGDTNRQRQLARELRAQHMRPVATFARANIRNVPELVALTTTGRKLGGYALATAAEAMAEAAKPYEQQFLDAKFPADFLAALVALAGAVRASFDARSKKIGQRSGATKGIAAELARGRTAVATLDAVVTKQLAGDEARLAEWRSAKRVTNKGGP